MLQNCCNDQLIGIRSNEQSLEIQSCKWCGEEMPTTILKRHGKNCSKVFPHREKINKRFLAGESLDALGKAYKVPYTAIRKLVDLDAERATKTVKPAPPPPPPDSWCTVCTIGIYQNAGNLGSHLQAVGSRCAICAKREPRDYHELYAVGAIEYQSATNTYTRCAS